MAILKTALRNRIRKHGGENFEFHTNNINLRGVRVGCSGFITNPENGKTIYVDTEETCYIPLADSVLWREAKHLKDHTGGQNRWSKRKNDQYVKDIIEFLKK